MALKVKPGEKLSPQALELSLVAPCGMNCGLCMCYLRGKNRCLGCRTEDDGKAKSVLACTIRKCEMLRSGKSASASNVGTSHVLASSASTSDTARSTGWACLRISRGSTTSALRHSSNRSANDGNVRNAVDYSVCTLRSASTAVMSGRDL